MARRSQCSSAGDNPLHPNYLPPHYREEYRLAVDALVEADLDGYYEFLQRADVVDFLSPPEIDYIQGSVQLPQQSNNPEHPYLDSDGEGSSDTYWPVHSDLEVPGLDLGWPQFHHTSGPTEVTTLVNPPEPDMPSIKEQARRLIKSAQQVIGIVMDMFTDVDILADILSAAMRNVAVYIILDEQNANHFLNMVNNCRVNLQGLQFLRVRVVSGITYHCRSGKSFKGQMMDRFLLTDCRAVLSGNYSFMWSFEKLHRCMAHLFLGQLVSTFDEEFRILFAQSQPLAIDTRPPQMEEFGLISKRTYPNIKTHLHREPRKFLSMDIPGQDDWTRQSYDDRMDLDWRAMQIKRQEAMTGPADMYNRFSPQQSRMDYDQGHSRMPKMDNSAFKRHSYAEGGQGRYSLPFMQAPELDPPSRQLDRGPQLNMGPESDYSGYDKFWNQDYHQMEPYPEKSFLPDLGPTDAFDPVANYLSSTRNRDFDQGQDKLQIPGDFNNRRSNVYQTSPTPSSTMEEKPFGQESTADRKDPLVKRGLRNWRINSYLCANDNPGDEGPSLTPPLAQDPFEEPPYGVQPKPQGMELSLPKIPNVREFRVPAIPRASQIPSYAKMSEQTKRSAEENAPAATKTPAEPKPTNQAETKTHGVTRTQSPLTLSETKAPALPPEIKTTPCPSESSSTTTDGEKPEELEQKEPISGLLWREESFRRKYNPGVQRSSRLRSSLIFSSLEQTEQQDEDSDKKETDLMKLSFASKRPAREPFKWTPKLKSTTVDSSSTNAEKTEGDESSKEEKSKDSAQKTSEPSSKGTDAEQRDVAPGPKPSQPEPPSVSLLHTSPFLDMNDPDQRLMFFKELAAKRRAAKAAEAEKSSEATKAPEVKNNIEPQKSQKPPGSSLVNSSEVKEANQEAVKVQVDTSQSCDGVSTDSEKMKQKISQLATATHISEDAQSHDPPELPRPADVTTQATPKIPEKLDVVLSPARSTAEPQIQESQDLESDAPSSCSTVICGGTKSDSNPPTSTPEPAAGEEHTSSDCSSVTPSTSSCPAENQNTSKDVPAPEVELYISEEPSPPPSVRPAEEPVRPPDTEKESTQASEATSLDTDSSCCQSSSLPALNTDDTSLLSTDTPTSGEGPRAQETDADDTTPGPPSEDTIADVTPVDSLTPDTEEPVTPTPSPVGVLTDPVTQETPPCEPDPTGAQSSDELEDSVEPDDVKTKTPTEMHESSEPTLTPVSTENGLEPESEKNLNPPEPADDEKELVEKDESETTVKESAQDKTSDQAKSEKTDEAPPPPSQPKQTKSRYHSSTANVISSSNLRDDTKLLLGQISANNQSRSEMSKEAPVTDDEKEDEADKKANVGTKSRGKQKTPQERQMLLEKIQSMRKERKVYSRFEMAP